MATKFSWEKLKGLVLSQHQNQNKKDDKTVNFHYRPCPKLLDDFTQASKDLDEMKKRKDAILYAAAVAASSASAFSESLREMGACLLEQSAVTDDEQNGNDLRMLSKAQFELQELVDSYRSHIFQIAAPSESILSELKTMEEMKQQCDEKRNAYQGLLAAQTKMEKSRSFKGKTDSSQQLQTAFIEYEREAICFVFRLNSLKKGHTRSLLTQAVQHHAAQTSLFSKGLKSLKEIDLEMRSSVEHQHNDHNSSGLQDRYMDRCASLSVTGNNLQYISPLELKKNEINLRTAKTNESNIERAHNKLYRALTSRKSGQLYELPSPPSARNTPVVQSAEVRRSQDLYATIENRLTPSSASSASTSYPLPIPLTTEYPSDARFYHSAPSTYPKLPRYAKTDEFLSSQYVHIDDGRVCHSAPLEISQDVYSADEIPWTPTNVTAYRLPPGSELPRGNYIPLTDERAKAILGSEL
ncbi:hypothetical protein C5167_000664 [Papaver somniferum]|uniref:BAR domain-containing protein n=1 Tax=Papaver somniferum TaxID=3469 RepID=A0A4Y7KUL6_PAPSO|nr:uncharacterized protein At2g33490-like [Papaver somniferum]RZC76556.1 hypothetical protein C5167_000664 [Papaver somniferum]